MLERFENGVKLIDYLRLKDAQGDIAGFNEDLSSKILAKGDQEELRDLLAFWRENGRTITEEEIGVFSYYQRLRQQVHEACYAGKEERRVKAPEKTGQEKIIGTYLEMIEPQVRQVVLNLNNKGFKTQGSGFGPENTQKIYCPDEQFLNINFSVSFLQELKKQGVDLELKPKSITLSLNRKLSLDEIEAVWQEIEKQIKPKNELLT